MCVPITRPESWPCASRRALPRDQIQTQWPLGVPHTKLALVHALGATGQVLGKVPVGLLAVIRVQQFKPDWVSISAASAMGSPTTVSRSGISVAHMGLIAQLEDNYGVLLDTDDIIDMSSVGKAREILAKYGVAF